MITIDGNAPAGAPTIDGNASGGSPRVMPRPAPFPTPLQTGWLRYFVNVNQAIVLNYTVPTADDWLISDLSWTNQSGFDAANAIAPDYESLREWLATQANTANIAIGGTYGSRYSTSQFNMDTHIAGGNSVYARQPTPAGRYFSTPILDPFSGEVTAHENPNPSRPGAELLHVDRRHIQDYFIEHICTAVMHADCPHTFCDDWGHLYSDVLLDGITPATDTLYASRVRHALNSLGKKGILNWGHPYQVGLLADLDFAAAVGRACDAVMFEQDTLADSAMKDDLRTGTLFRAHVDGKNAICDQGALVVDIPTGTNDAGTVLDELGIECRFWAAVAGATNWRSVVNWLFYRHVSHHEPISDWFNWPETLGPIADDLVTGSDWARQDFQNGRLDIDLTTREVTVTL